MDHKRAVILITVIFLFLNYCSIKTVPENVWGLRGKLVRLAESLKGIKYKYGGEEIYGFDCSGFVRYVYSSFGIEIARTAKKQGKMRPAVKFKSARPGDILVFRISRKLWHSGIFVSFDYFIHSPNGRGYVRREKYSKYWMKRLKKVISLLVNK